MENTELEHQWGSLHADFIDFLFISLNRKNIKYFILRNHEQLPVSNSGKDVDIVIVPRSYSMVMESILDTMRHFGIHYYQITQFDRMRCWYIMEHTKKFGIHIDIIENEIYKGFEFFSFNYLYKQVIKFKNFYVLNKPMDIVMLLVQNIVAYKRLKEKYRNLIASNYFTCKEACDSEILHFWGNNQGQKMIALLENKDFDAIENHAREFEKSALKRIFVKHPISTILQVGRFLAGKFYRIIWCPRKYWRFFAVEAPDGTGKTTFIENLILELRKYYVSDKERFCVHHFRPNIFPNLGAAGERAGIMKQDKDFTNPHRAKPSNAFSSFLRMLYYWTDYVIGIPLLLRKEVQYERFSIYDRYIYDFVVDPKRSRINLPRWVRVTFARLVIQPQIVFVLLADPDVIYKRKQELTKEEISRQLFEFKKLTSFGKHVVFIDANQDIDTMVGQATEIIMNRFLNKIRL